MATRAATAQRHNTTLVALKGAATDDHSKIPFSNVTLVLDYWAPNAKAYGYSFVTAKTLQRYGSGRIQYRVRRINFNLRKTGQQLRELFHVQPGRTSDALCVLISPNAERISTLKVRLPLPCKLLVTGDEYCEHVNAPIINGRQYFSSTMNQTTYVPLGPRNDFMEALQTQDEMTSSSWRRPSYLKSSERPLLFNAIFSKGTSPSRSELERVLHSLKPSLSANQSLYHIQIADQWTAALSEQHADSHTYLDILQRSKFTLCPMGHNAETFRLYEALEVGSIPILVIDEDSHQAQGAPASEYHQHPCRNGLAPILKEIGYVEHDALSAPIIILSSWSELPHFLQKVQNSWNATTLNSLQQRMEGCYDGLMNKLFRQVEEMILSIP